MRDVTRSDTTGNMFKLFRAEMQKHIDSGEDFHILHGPCRAREVRAALDLFMRLYPDIDVVCASECPPNIVFLINGLYSPAS